MSLKIIRDDITKMNTDAIVNTANAGVKVGDGCDRAIYNAAGMEELLAYRKKNIGEVPEGEVFITPGFNLQAKYIIHAVSPFFDKGDNNEELKLRSCYRKSLELAVKNNISSIAFPLISTGCFGYPKEEGMRIAVDEINAFLLSNDIEVVLVVFDGKSTSIGEKLYPDLEKYIDQNYVSDKGAEEYKEVSYDPEEGKPSPFNFLRNVFGRSQKKSEAEDSSNTVIYTGAMPMASRAYEPVCAMPQAKNLKDEESEECSVNIDSTFGEEDDDIDELQIEAKLKERMEHMSDTFSQYLLYLIQERNMENADVYKRAIVDKKIFSKLKNNVDYQPQKLTALCLCVGAKLNLDETKDLLSRAGYALSPCSKTDIIFSYFIENEIYDMIEIDIQLEEHGLPCIIS